MLNLKIIQLDQNQFHLNILHTLFIPVVLLFTLCGCATFSSTNNFAVFDQDDQVEESDSGCAYFYFLWGNHAEREQDYEEALEAYEKALICDPEADYIAGKMPVLLLRMNRNEEAVVWLRQDIAEKPDSSGSRMLLAKVYMRLSRFDEAVEQYRLLYSHHPEDKSSLLMLGELYLHLKRFDDAEKVLSEALISDDQKYPALVLLGRLYLVRKAYDKALASYYKALDENWSAELLYEITEVYYRQEKFDKIEQIYRDILEKDASDENSRAGLIHLYLLQDKEEEALRELQELKEISRDPGRVDLAIARLYIKGKNFKRATSVLQMIVEAEEVSEARYLLAVVLYQQDLLEEALTQLSFIKEDDREYLDAVYLQIRILRAKNEIDKCIVLLSKILDSKKSQKAELFVLLASFYLQQEKQGEAQKVFQRSIKLYPADPELFYEYALFLDNTGKVEEAMETMKKVIGMKPDHAAALNYVGYMWADKNVYLEKALEYIKKAVEIKPKNGYIRDSLGWVYFRLGMVQDAVRELEEALRLGDDDPAILEHLGDAYQAMDRTDDALKMYQKAIELYGEEGHGKEVLEKIRAMEK
ncbi:MAG: tetratricopeptide repeat protein [Desulfobulbaceae bacterium]|nr:tetratricopeptide repeat protein [Desulfobulbaceae bacterium]